MFPMSMFKKCLERKEDHMRHGKSLSRIIPIHHRMPKFPRPVFLRPKSLYGNMIETLNQAVIGVIKKRAKVYHSLPMSYGELLPVLIQNYGISVTPVKPRRPPYPRGYNVNAICKYHRGVGGHSVENCKALKDKVQSLLYADPIKFRKLISGRQEH